MSAAAWGNPFRLLPGVPTAISSALGAGNGALSAPFILGLLNGLPDRSGSPASMDPIVPPVQTAYSRLHEASSPPHPSPRSVGYYCGTRHSPRAETSFDLVRLRLSNRPDKRRLEMIP